VEKVKPTTKPMFKKLTAAMIAVSLLSVVSCDKRNITEIPKGIPSRDIPFKKITTEQTVLSQDKDFIAICHNDITLKLISESFSDKYPSIDFTNLKGRLASCVSVDEMRSVYSAFGIAEGDKIVDITIENFNLMMSIKEKYPFLITMSEQDFMLYWSDEHKKVMQLQTIGLTCSQQYAQAIADCNEDYFAALGLAGLSAAVSGPAAFVTFAVGVAGAILIHHNCMERAKRDYNNCSN